MHTNEELIVDALVRQHFEWLNGRTSADPALVARGLSPRGRARFAKETLAIDTLWAMASVARDPASFNSLAKSGR